MSRIASRSGAWLIIGAVHVALIYVVTSWSPTRVALQSAPIEASIIETPAPVSEAPPPPLPQLEQPTLPTIEQPLVTINEEPAPTAITVAVAPQPVPAAVATAPTGPRVVT